MRPQDPKVFWIDYRDPEGVRRRERSGTYEQAVEKLRRRKEQIRRNEYVAPRQSRKWTFERLVREAIASKALRLTDSTVKTDGFRKRKLLPLIGKIRVDHLTPQRIEAALAQLKGEGLSSSTLNRYRSFISSVFSYGVKNEHVSSNPCARVGRFKENAARIRCLGEDEEKKLRLEIVEDRHLWEFDLALNTGMRRGELFGLKWADVHFDREELYATGKTGQRHIIANERAIAALVKLGEISGEKTFVVPEHNDRPSAVRDWRRWFEVAVKKAGIKNFRFHDIRHTFASRLAIRGVDILRVQKLMGHKSIKMTEKYSHLRSDDLHRAAAKAK